MQPLRAALAAVRRVAALAALCGVAASAALAQDSCAEDEVLLRGDWGTARFAIEIADTADERSRGLMFVEKMPRMSGMLFVYEYPQRMSFWMRNTLIPLDMLFIDADGVVGHIHHNAIPGDETGIPGQGERLAVLEINGGMAKAMGITVGTEMRHAAFGEDAAWPCD